MGRSGALDQPRDVGVRARREPLFGLAGRDAEGREPAGEVCAVLRDVGVPDEGRRSEEGQGGERGVMREEKKKRREKTRRQGSQTVFMDRFFPLFGALLGTFFCILESRFRRQ